MDSQTDFKKTAPRRLQGNVRTTSLRRPNRIGTNILLEFYRALGNDIGLGLLEKISDHHDRIITVAKSKWSIRKIGNALFLSL